MPEFLGYPRANGAVGIRNYVAIIPSVCCVDGVVNKLAQRVPEAVALRHGHGCGRGGVDAEIHARTLINLGRNPNVAAVLVVGLGCEVLMAEHIAAAIAASGKPVACLNVQKDGGSPKTVEKGERILHELLSAADAAERQPFGLDKLTLALNCGGSDAFSGVTANPTVGVVADWVVANGGTVVLTETTEMIGTSHILANRACRPELGQQIVDAVNRQEQLAEQVLGPIAKALISPGNMDGGMSSIREKSLGCIVKGGTSTINGLIRYAEVPSTRGLVIMDGPGYDAESLTGEVAAGAQAVIFTTGRGTPIGFPIAPVIKVASNSQTHAAMPDDFDLNAGQVLEGRSLSQVGRQLTEVLQNVLNGAQTKAELNQRNDQVYLWTTATSF